MALSPQDLLRSARNVSGIDLVDPEAERPLSVLIESLNREAELSVDGEKYMRDHLIHLLANRLRMERDYAAHPEIADEKLAPPLCVYGLPRTGTTKLQKLLSVTGDFNSLPLWMAYNPSLLTGDRAEDCKKRIEDTERYVNWMRATSPGMDAIHHFECFEPEEVNPVLEQGFRSLYPNAFVTVPSYNAWVAQEGGTKQIAYMRRVLKYLQWQFCPGSIKPWVLKNPTFLGMEPDILAIFPDARLIVTHRHPSYVIASSASLIVNFHKLYSDVDATPVAGSLILGGQSWLAQEHLKNRAERKNLDIIDVAFSDLTADDIGAVESVYRRVGLAFTATARQNILAWQPTEPHMPGAHKYTLASFGLSTAQVEAAFAGYIAAFAAYFEPTAR